MERWDVGITAQIERKPETLKQPMKRVQGMVQGDKAGLFMRPQYSSFPLFHRSILLLFRDRGFIQLEGFVKSPDRQFRIFGIDDARDFDL